MSIFLYKYIKDKFQLLSFQMKLKIFSLLIANKLKKTGIDRFSNRKQRLNRNDQIRMRRALDLRFQRAFARSICSIRYHIIVDSRKS